MHPHAALYQLTYTGLVKCQELDGAEAHTLAMEHLLSPGSPERERYLQLMSRMKLRAAKISKAQLLLSALLAGGEADFIRAQVALEEMYHDE